MLMQIFLGRFYSFVVIFNYNCTFGTSRKWIGDVQAYACFLFFLLRDCFKKSNKTTEKYADEVLYFVL